MAISLVTLKANLKGYNDIIWINTDQCCQLVKYGQLHPSVLYSENGLIMEVPGQWPMIWFAPRTTLFVRVHLTKAVLSPKMLRNRNPHN